MTKARLRRRKNINLRKQDKELGYEAIGKPTKTAEKATAILLEKFEKISISLKKIKFHSEQPRVHCVLKYTKEPKIQVISVKSFHNLFKCLNYKTGHKKVVLTFCPDILRRDTSCLLLALFTSHRKSNNFSNKILLHMTMKPFVVHIINDIYRKVVEKYAKTAKQTVLKASKNLNYQRSNLTTRLNLHFLKYALGKWDEDSSLTRSIEQKHSNICG